MAEGMPLVLRTVRVDPDRWELAKGVAQRDGTTISAMIREFLTEVGRVEAAERKSTDAEEFLE